MQGSKQGLNARQAGQQENVEEFAEIFSASGTDMSAFSAKPEKSAILEETVNQITNIKPVSESSVEVQQSQVSSSKPTILASDILGPLLLQVLDGFVFMVNGQGKVDYMSENVQQYLKYSQDELVGKSVYNIIHVGDHAAFSNSLLPMSQGAYQSPSKAGSKSRNFNCRMLVKPSCEDTDDVEAKQTRQYESMHISASPFPGEKLSDTSENSEGQSCLVCITRRLPSEKSSTMLGVEYFSTTQDIHGKILDCDTSGISSGHYSPSGFKGHNINEFCHAKDVHLFGQAHSRSYQFSQ
ncbi:hypothetical protein ScPMuIL_008005 [Solemya velum]